MPRELLDDRRRGSQGEELRHEEVPEAPRRPAFQTGSLLSAVEGLVQPEVAPRLPQSRERHLLPRSCLELLCGFEEGSEGVREGYGPMMM